MDLWDYKPEYIAEESCGGGKRPRGACWLVLMKFSNFYNVTEKLYRLNRHGNESDNHNKVKKYMFSIAHFIVF